MSDFNYQGYTVRQINGLYYAFDSTDKTEPMQAALGCLTREQDIKRKITLKLKGRYLNRI